MRRHLRRRCKCSMRQLINSFNQLLILDCVKCGACENACPQHISIREELEKAAKALA